MHKVIGTSEIALGKNYWLTVVLRFPLEEEEENTQAIKLNTINGVHAIH